jgi:drug/metabolite transporter (DMT)-like permease
MQLAPLLRGDLTFDLLGYTLALASALCTACYVVLVAGAVHVDSP